MNSLFRITSLSLHFLIMRNLNIIYLKQVCNILIITFILHAKFFPFMVLIKYSLAFDLLPAFEI